jgi:hypothetical protein
MSFLDRWALRRIRKTYLNDEKYARTTLALAAFLRNALPDHVVSDYQTWPSGVYRSDSLADNGDPMRKLCAEAGGSEFWFEDKRISRVHSIYVVPELHTTVDDEDVT